MTLRATEAQAKLQLETQKHFDEVALQEAKIANERAKILSQARSEQEERELNAIFKAADLEQQAAKSRNQAVFELLKGGATNVQNEQAGA